MKKKVEYLDLKSFLAKFNLWKVWRKKYKLTNEVFYSGSNKKMEVFHSFSSNNQPLFSALNAILLEDKWDEKSLIFMPFLDVDTSYVNKYLSYVSRFRDHCEYNEIKTIIYYAIAIRFFIEKNNQKIPMFSTKLSLEKSIEDFNALKNHIPHSLYLDFDVGRDASNFWMEEFRQSCAKEGKKYTFKELWSSAALIGKIVSYMKINKSIKKACFAQMAKDFTPSQFRPSNIKYLVNFINMQDKRVNIKNYLNLCGGWGDRLVGALATPEIRRYVQTDPNKEIFQVTKNICDLYNSDANKEVYLYDKAMEDLSFDELCPNQEKNDLVAYSPPYFNKEQYPGKDQSYKRYKTIDSWVENFLFESVRVSYKALKVDGILAINIANIQSQTQTIYQLSDCLAYFLDNDMSPYFSKFAEPLIYPTLKVSHISKIFLYQAKEYKDSIPKLPSFTMTPWTIKKRIKKNQPKDTLEGKQNNSPSNDKIETILPEKTSLNEEVKSLAAADDYSNLQQCSFFSNKLLCSATTLSASNSFSHSEALVQEQGRLSNKRKFQEITDDSASPPPNKKLVLRIDLIHNKVSF